MSKVTKITLVAVLLILAATCSFAKPFIQPNDKVVFLGDSITAQRLYTQYVQNYYTAFHPEWKVSFVNAGVGGDRSSAAVNRVEKDVIDQNPTVVTICFGMNDAAYRPTVDPDGLKKFSDGLKQLISMIQEKTKARIVLLTTTCVDANKNPKLVGYNPTLAAFVDETKKIAQSEKLPVIDLHHPMLTQLEKGQAADPTFTLIPDGVHPNEAGHTLMADTILRAWGEKVP